MKMKKLILPLRLLLIAVLIAAVALTIASCGNGTGTGTQKATEAATEASVNEEVAGAGSASREAIYGNYTVNDLQGMKDKKIEIVKFIIGNVYILDGEYYNVDCLWDDTASDTYGSTIYPFFNLTDEAFRYHTRISMAVGLPQCNGTKYKYSNYFGKTVEAENIVFVDEE